MHLNCTYFEIKCLDNANIVTPATFLLSFSELKYLIKFLMLLQNVKCKILNEITMENKVSIFRLNNLTWKERKAKVLEACVTTKDMC